MSGLDTGSDGRMRSFRELGRWSIQRCSGCPGSVRGRRPVTGHRSLVHAASRVLHRFAGRMRRRPPAPKVPTNQIEDASRWEQLTLRILGTIHNNSILLRGPSGAGKTTLLRAIEQRLLDHDDPSMRFIPVFIGLQGVRERHLFATLGNSMLEAVHPFLPLDTSREPSPDRRGYSHRHFADDMRRVIRAAGPPGASRPKIVLLIDDLDEMQRFDPRTAQRLRGLFMTGLSDHLVMVATAVHIDKKWELEGSPWYNFFEEIELPSRPEAGEGRPCPG